MNYFMIEETKVLNTIYTINRTQTTHIRPSREETVESPQLSNVISQNNVIQFSRSFKTVYMSFSNMFPCFYVEVMEQQSSSLRGRVEGKGFLSLIMNSTFNSSLYRPTSQMVRTPTQTTIGRSWTSKSWSRWDLEFTTYLL